MKDYLSMDPESSAERAIAGEGSSPENSIDIALARQIIEKTKSLFPYPTNICNNNGIMIASTTPERIGSYHEGAVVMIRNNWDELPITDEGQYAGTKKGISHPIRLNRKTIGSIGLTGDLEKVAGYSKLLQAFTELLVENSYTSRQARMNERSLQSFIIHWLSSDYNIPKQEFALQMRKFGFNWTGEFSVVVIKNPQTPQLNNDTEYMLRFLHRFMIRTDSQKNLFITHDLYIIWISNLSPGKVLRETAETLLKEVRKWEKRPLLFGIGKKYENHQQGRRSYLEALKAVSLADIQNPIIDYCEDIVNIALDSVQEDTKKECVEQVFGCLTEEEITGIADFAAAYHNCNGSINEIARRLFMHKNTVQYRILKINEQLGFDIRNIKNQLRLQMACTFFRQNGAGNQN